MTAIQALLDWAESAGVEINGLAPQALPGKGIGVMASRDLKKGEIVLDVPASAIHCLDNIPGPIRKKLEKSALRSGSPRLSLHGLLAASLFMRSEKDLAGTRTKPTPEDESKTLFDPVSWAGCAPSYGSFKQGFPYLWPPALKALVPGAVEAIVETQSAKILNDFAAVRSAITSSSSSPAIYPFPDAATVSEEVRYTHAWLLINSRTFYNLTDSTQQYPYDERLALVPLADLFNHTPSPGSINKPGKAPVSASFGVDSYTFTVNQDIPAGDEICISYGEHSNDFLLAEYGFFFTSTSSSSSSSGEQLHNGGNPNDSISLLEGITPMLSADREAKIIQAHRHLNASEGDLENVPGDETMNALASCSLAVVPKQGGAGFEVLLSPMLQATLQIIADDARSPASIFIFEEKEEWAPCPSDHGVAAALALMVNANKVQAEQKLEALRKVSVSTSEASVKDLLSERWRQIEQTCGLALDAIIKIVEKKAK